MHSWYDGVIGFTVVMKLCGQPKKYSGMNSRVIDVVNRYALQSPSRASWCTECTIWGTQNEKPRNMNTGITSCTRGG